MSNQEKKMRVFKAPQSRTYQESELELTQEAEEDEDLTPINFDIEGSIQTIMRDVVELKAQVKVLNETIVSYLREQIKKN